MGNHWAEVGRPHDICVTGTYLWISARADGFVWWSQTSMIQWWNFASYVANLFARRWVRRALAWEPSNISLFGGRLQQPWDVVTKVQAHSVAICVIVCNQCV